VLTQVSMDPIRIGQLARLNPRVVQQYLDLLPIDPRQTQDESADRSETSSADLLKNPTLSELPGPTIEEHLDV